MTGRAGGVVRSPGVAPRSRLALAVALMAVVALGLLSRRHPLPGVFAEYTGDGLYAVAVFVALAVLTPGARSSRLGALAFGLCVVVELSQLVRWEPLDALRATRLGALVLGQGFQGADLLAYALGAGLATVGDGALRRRRGADPVGPSDRA